MEGEKFVTKALGGKDVCVVSSLTSIFQFGCTGVEERPEFDCMVINKSSKSFALHVIEYVVDVGKYTREYLELWLQTFASEMGNVPHFLKVNETFSRNNSL